MVRLKSSVSQSAGSQLCVFYSSVAMSSGSLAFLRFIRLIVSAVFAQVMDEETLPLRSTSNISAISHFWYPIRTFKLSIIRNWVDYSCSYKDSWTPTMLRSSITIAAMVCPILSRILGSCLPKSTCYLWSINSENTITLFPCISTNFNINFVPSSTYWVLYSTLELRTVLYLLLLWKRTLCLLTQYWHQAIYYIGGISQIWYRPISLV